MRPPSPVESQTLVTCQLSVIVPMYNEEASIDAFFARLEPILNGTGESWEMICINDGSADGTLAALQKHHARDPRIKIIDFSRNFGKEAALSAGIDFAGGASVIPIDADLQDTPELIPDMLKQWRNGYQVVLATRKERAGESWLKKATAAAFYRVIGTISDSPVPENTGDFRLMDRQVVDTLKQLQEKNRFMKGIFSWPGFRTTTLYFDRDPRFAGTSAWNFWKLWKFALDGIFAFTTAPLKIWVYLGTMISFCTFIYAMFLILRGIFFGVDVPGYTSIMVVMLLLGGIQLVSLGIIGEYVGRIYNESKNRPIYVVSKTYGL